MSRLVADPDKLFLFMENSVQMKLLIPWINQKNVFIPHFILISIMLIINPVLNTK